MTRWLLQVKFLFVLLPCTRVYKCWYCISYTKRRRLLTVWIQAGLLLHVCILDSLSLFSYETRAPQPTSPNHHHPPPPEIASSALKYETYWLLLFGICDQTHCIWVLRYNTDETNSHNRNLSSQLATWWVSTLLKIKVTNQKFLQLAPYS